METFIFTKKHYPNLIIKANKKITFDQNKKYLSID